MSLQDIEIKSEYRSFHDDVVRDFYIPLLRQAKIYKRAVGFFSSSALVKISKGLTGLVKNNGKIFLVASPYLSSEDVEAIRMGYKLRDEVVKGAILEQLREPRSNIEKERLNFLAYLIAEGILDIKIAFTENEEKMGMYHEKMGIIQDNYGNKVAFSGSMNESATAMTANYEAIDVFCSWKGENDRVITKEKAFSSIWSNNEPNIRIIEFPSLKQEIISRYKMGLPNFKIDEEEFEHNNQSILAEEQSTYSIEPKIGPTIPLGVKLHDYQMMAIDEWEKRQYHGIFDMATGTGKTFAGLGAIVRISHALSNKLAVIIVCPFQHLVEQWVDDIKLFNIEPIIGYSASIQKDWKRRLEDAIRDQKLRVKNKEFFCFITTNATFASEFVQYQVQKIKGDLLLVIDEAHNFGAPNLSKLLSNKYKYRLALSATLERHNDEMGTNVLYSFFGDKCIDYPLEKAIKEKKLTPYKYYPILVTLNDEELQQYSDLTYEIGKCLIKDKNGRLKLNEKGKIIALKRARLVAGAQDKITKLEEVIAPYIEDKHILVYCGATKMLKENQETTDVDEEDLRQIDVVTDLLGNKLNMKVSQFTSKEDIEEREVLKREFSRGENLQALIAIKCLDEGVNIPKIKVAFILASTTNPKEYIQRRGRVLRLSEGKHFAEIYDFITLPRPLDEVPSLTEEQMKRELSLVKNELNRAEEFARIAMNMAEAEQIIDQIKEAYDISNDLYTLEEGYYYEQ